MIASEVAYYEVEKLVKSFKNLPAARRKAMNEMQTRLGYILPLFSALGWNTSNIDEVSPEEKVSRGWVDFSFRIGNVPRFFLETKKVNEDLNDPRWVKQAIDYAWTKSVTWALLSDFEGLRVFNAEWKESDPFRAQFIEFNLDTYLTEFEQLWWLSRPETELRQLDKKAEKWGKKIKRQPVNEHLFDRLKYWRGVLYKDYKNFNPVLAGSADAIVLRLLNRLIFIRTAEDREVEEVRLHSLVRELDAQHRFKDLPAELSRLFREFDKTYNSQLFAPHSLDGAYATPSILREVIEGLYGSDRTVYYNFNAIESDVLGTIYEQYLGSAVVDDEPNDKPTQLSLLGDDALPVQERRQKRKSQGIYYTPTFVTKYIVQQTVGRRLDEQNYDSTAPLRVLDMACGSGSFLIEAFDVIDNFASRQLGHAQTEVFGAHDRERQLEVMQNCIFGVDKDKQAVEVARLNLLLRALHLPAKLPMLDHIVNANSLECTVFETSFPQIMEEGGFDVIVGNPPYIRAENMPRDARDYYMAGDFETAYGRFDIFILFVERAIKLLKEGGRLGFIIPYAGFTQNYGLLLRKFILDTCVIEKIVDLSQYKVFTDASVATCVLILRKESSLGKRLQNSISIVRQASYDDGIIGSGFGLAQSVYLDTPNHMFRLNLDNDILRLAEKIDSLSLPLGQICYSITGVVAHDSVTGASKDRLIHSKRNGDTCKPYIEAKEFQGRYSSLSPKRFIEYRPDEMHRPKFPELFESPKILIPDIIGGGELSSTIDREGIYTNHSFNCCVPKTYLVDLARNLGITKDDAELSRSYSLEYLLGLINSRLMAFYFNNILGGGMHASPANVRRLPIRCIDFEKHAQSSMHDRIVKLVQKMLALQKEMSMTKPEDDLDRVRALDQSIRRLDQEIDRAIYKLYDLTDDEVQYIHGA